MISNVKKDYGDDYSFVQAHLADAVIRKHVESFNGYVALMNKKIDDEFDRPLNQPGKHDDDCLHNIIIPKESVTSSKKKLCEGYIELPLSRQ